MIIFWDEVKNSLPNLRVLRMNGVEVGFVYRPDNTGGDVNAWRAHIGIGEKTKFLGHNYRCRLAQEMVESAAYAALNDAPSKAFEPVQNFVRNSEATSEDIKNFLDNLARPASLSV